METAVKIPLSQRINLRIIVFAAVMLALIGYPLYVYLDSVVSGGIKEIGGGYKQVDLKTMVSFPFDQTNGKPEDVPEKWRALDGQKVVLEGEMRDMSGTSNKLTEFDLVYSIAECCYSGPPQIQHFIHSRVVDGKQVNYYSGLVKVAGTLHVNVKRAQGRVESVFQFDVESVEQ